MKALEVRHQLSVAGIGKEQHHPDRLHKKAMCEDNYAAAFTSRRKPSVCEPADRFASAIDKQGERLRVGAINIFRILPLPVGHHMGFAIQLTCAAMKR